MIGPFGLRPKGTMSYRALPMARALAARGHQVAIFLPPFHTPEEGGRTWDDVGVRIVNVSLGPRVPGFQHLLIAGRLSQAALAWQPDVIHFFKPKAYAGLSAWMLWHGRALGCTRARLVMDTDDWEGPGGWNDIEAYSYAQKRFFAWQEVWGLRHNDAVTVGSRALEALVFGLGVDRERLFYVPNGIGQHPETVERSSGEADGHHRLTSQRIREQYRLDNAPVVLLYTRFFEYTVERLLNTWRRVLEACPAARLLVVGAGLFEEEKVLLDQAQMIPFVGGDLSTSITYAGWADPQDIPAYFQTADLALYLLDNTLLNRAKCPVKLVELLAAGVPVVADAVGQACEYIQGEQTGLLVPPGDVTAMAEAALALLHDPARRAMLSYRSTLHMRQQFCWDGLVLEVEHAYGLA